SIDQILKNNYRSVIWAQDMKEALERQDSATTFYLAGQKKKAVDQYELYRPKFEAAICQELHNITEPGEQEMADDIDRWFKSYTADVRKLLYARPSLTNDLARVYYFSTLEPAFVRIKNRAQDVLDIN